MTYEVLSILRVKTKQGETILSPGQIITLNPSNADTLLAQGKIKLTDKEFLEKTLDVILFSSRDKIIEAYEGMQYQNTDEIRGIEDEIGRIYKGALQGLSSLADFQAVCEKWVLVCKEILRKRTQN